MGSTEVPYRSRLSKEMVYRKLVMVSLSLPLGSHTQPMLLPKTAVYLQGSWNGLEAKAPRRLRSGIINGTTHSGWEIPASPMYLLTARPRLTRSSSVHCKRSRQRAEN